MRIIACFAIILLHSLFASTVYYGESMSSFDIAFERIFEHLLMWAVPLFLMISGALLLDPEREVTIKKVYTKYIRRLLTALIVFTLVFQILDYVMEGADGIFSEWIHDLISGQSWAHMWYLYMMIGIYITLPLYKRVAMAGKKLVAYTIIILVVFTSVVPMIGSFGYEIAFGIPTATVYPVYLFLGYYFCNNRLSAKASFCFLAVGTAVIAVTSYIGTSEWMLAFSKYNSIFVIMQTVGIFGLLYRVNFRENRFAESLNQCSFGIYMIHMIGVRAVMKWLEVDPYVYGPMFFILMGIVLFFVSYAVTYVIRKIPVLEFL